MTVMVIAAVAAGLFVFRGRPPSFREEIAARGPLNLVLVTADTLRADKLGTYGNEGIETPALDALAGSGVLFENATTAVPMTLPAHASILTGTYPLHHGVRDNGGYYLEPENVTLAERLGEQGYATGAFVAAFVLDSRWGLDQGFDRYFDDFDLSRFDQVSLDKVHRRGDAVLKEALSWMKSVRDEKFFSWIHFYDPHTPYDPPEPFRSRYQNHPDGLYDGEVAYLDSLVSELVGWLAAEHLSESTLVVVVGDHGESLGEHGEATHGYYVYDSTMQVPFILRAPFAALEGRRVVSQVRTIDLMPTVLDLLDVSAGESVQGVSLLPLALGEVQDMELSAYGESYLPRYHYGWSELRSLRTGTLHFIDAPRPELFDLRLDPEEERDLARERVETVRQLRETLASVQARYRREGVDERRPEPLDAETEARLGALGYLGAPTRPTIDPGRALADPKDKIDLYNLMKEAGNQAGDGRPGDALASIDRVLSLDSEILEAHHSRGNLLGQLGRTGEALAAYRTALTVDPEYKPALSGLAFTYKEIGRREEAALGFGRLLALDPRDNRASFMLAQIRIEQERYREALGVLGKAADAGSERALLHNLTAECYIELGRLDEADAEVDKALSIQPGMVDAHFHRGRIREQRGDLKGAVASYQKELETAPDSFRAHFNLAKLLGPMGRGQEMLEHLRRAIESKPDFAIAYLYLANVYLEQGELDKALLFANQGLELGPEPNVAALGHFILADIYDRQGRVEESRRELARGQTLQKS